jgi:hypothetical protein
MTMDCPQLTLARPGVTVVQIGATERAIEWATVEVSCEYRLSHGYDIISLGQSTIHTCDVIMTSLEHSGTACTYDITMMS